jgi:hypothetical protein
MHGYPISLDVLKGVSNVLMNFNGVKASFEMEEILLFLTFFCEIELFLMKFQYDPCEIPKFGSIPKDSQLPSLTFERLVTHT